MVEARLVVNTMQQPGRRIRSNVPQISLKVLFLYCVVQWPWDLDKTGSGCEESYMSDEVTPLALSKCWEDAGVMVNLAWAFCWWRISGGTEKIRLRISTIACHRPMMIVWMLLQSHQFAYVLRCA